MTREPWWPLTWVQGGIDTPGSLRWRDPGRQRVATPIPGDSAVVELPNGLTIVVNVVYEKHYTLHVYAGLLCSEVVNDLEGLLDLRCRLLTLAERETERSLRTKPPSYSERNF